MHKLYYCCDDVNGTGIGELKITIKIKIIEGAVWLRVSMHFACNLCIRFYYTNGVPLLLAQFEKLDTCFILFNYLSSISLSLSICMIIEHHADFLDV